MENDQNKFNRVIAYIRKSSEDNDDGEASKQLNSIEYQRRFVKEAIEKYNLTLVHQNFEDDKTGYIAFVREGFQEMLTYLESHKGEVDGIVCTEISRLARNFGDGGMILWYLQSGIIKRIYTPTKIFTDSSSDQLMVAIEIAMSKKSSDEGSERTKRGMSSKAHTLRHPARPAILGYVTEGRVGVKKWVVDIVTGPLVKQVFEHFATGLYTLEEIADYAFTIGLRSKDSKSSKGKISANTWRNRLIDRKYTGIFEHDEEEIVGDYEVLISTELFYAVQDVLFDNQHPKAIHIDYAYTGLVKCSRCGDELSGTHKKGITYYRCGKKKSPCKEIERVPYMTEKKLEKDLMTKFEEVEIDEETWRIARDYVIELNEPEKAEIRKQILRLSGKVEAEKQLQVELGRKFGRDELVKSDYDKLMKDSKMKEASLRNAIVKCENIILELNELMYKFLDDVKYVTKRLRKASPANKKEIVEIFCENFVWDYEKLRWDWKNPYFLMTKSKKNSSVLPIPSYNINIERIIHEFTLFRQSYSTLSVYN